DVLRSHLSLRQRCHDKTRVGSFGQVLGFGKDAALAAPTVLRAVLEVLEEACRLSSLFEFLARLLQFLFNLPKQHIVLGLPLTHSSCFLSLCVVPFHSACTVTHSIARVNLFDTLGEFAPSTNANIFNA